MDKNNFLLTKEDYEEPACLLCGEPMGKSAGTKSVDVRRFLEKMDEYMGRHDYIGAEHHLNFWLGEAKICNNKRAELSIRNEMMGFYRKTVNQEKAIKNALAALSLVETLENSETITAATTFVNAATVYDAFSMPEKSMPLFERARAVYEKELKSTDSKLGGLYNNMALALVALKRYGEAYEMYNKALAVMAQVENGEPEQAITYLNMANAVEAEHGFEKAEAKIQQYLDKASALLEAPSVPHNGYYAFVCEKCAPTFDYYGWFLYADDLKERAGKIYAGS